MITVSSKDQLINYADLIKDIECAIKKIDFEEFLKPFFKELDGNNNKMLFKFYVERNRSSFKSIYDVISDNKKKLNVSRSYDSDSEGYRFEKPYSLFNQNIYFDFKNKEICFEPMINRTILLNEFSIKISIHNIGSAIPKQVARYYYDLTSKEELKEVIIKSVKNRLKSKSKKMSENDSKIDLFDSKDVYSGVKILEQYSYVKMYYTWNVNKLTDSEGKCRKFISEILLDSKNFSRNIIKGNICGEILKDTYINNFDKYIDIPEITLDFIKYYPEYALKLITKKSDIDKVMGYVVKYGTNNITNKVLWNYWAELYPDIKQILIDENISGGITNPFAFNNIVSKDNMSTIIVSTFKTENQKLANKYIEFVDSDYYVETIDRTIAIMKYGFDIEDSEMIFLNFIKEEDYDDFINHLLDLRSILVERIRKDGTEFEK